MSRYRFDQNFPRIPRSSHPDYNFNPFYHLESEFLGRYRINPYTEQFDIDKRLWEWPRRDYRESNAHTAIAMFIIIIRPYLRVRRETVGGQVGTPFLTPNRAGEMNSSFLNTCAPAEIRGTVCAYKIAIYGLLMSSGEALIHHGDPETTAKRDKGVISATRIVR